MEDIEYQHPTKNKNCRIVIGGDYITTESGTGIVHTAPGHGIDDFNVGQKNNLPTTCVVDEKGFLNEYSGKFKGLNVLKDANDLIIEYLKGNNLLLLQVEQYILDNVNNQITTEDISKEVNYSEAYISRVFKKKFGLSPHAFLVNQKINAAKNKLLNSKNQDISQLAVEVGFYDQSHFTNTFKRYFSLTPKQYQKGE